MQESAYGIGNYQRARIITADPGKLVLICYEGAISHLRMARDRALEKDFEAKAGALQKVLDILNELKLGLNFEKGGEIARNLEALYSYMIRRILIGDTRKDPKAFDEVIGLLEELEAAWKTIFNGVPGAAHALPGVRTAPGEPGGKPETANGWRA